MFKSHEVISNLVFPSIAIFLLASSCSIWKGDFEEVVVSDEESYSINPNTILEKISQGKSDIFITGTTISETAALPPAVVNWKQREYQLILHALFKQVWNEPIEDWDLDFMLFRLDCNEVNNGPQFGSFSYHKIITLGEQESRLRRDVYIEPDKNSVRWVERIYTPVLRKHRPIDLSQVKISVEDALLIAEKNGGSQGRSVIGNSCHISLGISPGSRYEGWQVRYTGSSSGNVIDFFSIIIDPKSGKFQIINPKTK